MKEEKKYRSDCPQYLALDVFGDKWTFLIVRDMMIEGKKYFREFLQSKEKIASNILASRLQSMEQEGLIHRKSDPEHKQKIIYLLTEKGIDLFPILMENTRWSLKYKPVGDRDRAKAKAMLDKGYEGYAVFMDQLREAHLSSE